MELTKNDSKMLQGLSVLAMVWLHLFDTWDYINKFTPILYWGGWYRYLFISRSFLTFVYLDLPFSAVMPT